MNTLKSRDQAVAAVTQQLEAVIEIVRRTNYSGDTNLGFEQLRRWKEKSVHVLLENVSEAESQKLYAKRLGSFAMGQLCKI
jgi:hypothetical protein